MAKKCWFASGVGCDNVSRSGYFCSELMEVVPGGLCGGVRLRDAEGLSDANPNFYSAKTQTVVQVSCSKCSGCCTDLDPSQKFDCINGGCVPASTYNTPGKYANAAACQSGCAKDSSCTGECVSAAEIAALGQALNNLQAKSCG
jgi:hypothetical protein